MSRNDQANHTSDGVVAPYCRLRSILTELILGHFDHGSGLMYFQYVRHQQRTHRSCPRLLLAALTLRMVYLLIWFEAVVACVVAAVVAAEKHFSGVFAVSVNPDILDSKERPSV